MNIDIYIGGKKFRTSAGLVSGKQLFDLASLDKSRHLFLEVEDELDVPVFQNEYLVLTGNECFSVSIDDSGIPPNPCLRTPLEIQVNNLNIEGADSLKHPKLTGGEIKALDPEAQNDETLFLDLSGIPDEAISDEFVFIVRNGQHFISTPCGNVGDKHSILDEHFLKVKELFPTAEFKTERGTTFLVLNDIELNESWTPSKINILFVIPNGYPLHPMDMFYISPTLKLKSGKLPEKGDVFETYLGMKWQRFSWHYSNRRWNPNKDNLLSHIQFSLSRLMANAW